MVAAMSLTNDEQHALTVIEQGLRRDDPLLVDRFACAPTVDQQRCRVVWARRMMAVGAVFTFFGLITSSGIISLGAILCCYGMVILVIAFWVVVRNRSLDSGGERRFPRR